nr:reverse transcriptase domain-containing protein [Tanacetum cinerariifolium]
ECRRLKRKQMVEESFERNREVEATKEVLINPSRAVPNRGTHIKRKPFYGPSCPKDYYPLPNIDCKVESVMGFKYKCFLDAYKGYHQIQMAKEDEEKTAFYTDHETNLEAYMDDMVIKSKDEKMLLADIVETFDNLKKINKKLNPKKSSFGVDEGKSWRIFFSDAPEGEQEELYFQMPEVPVEKDDIKIWTLFTDGASSRKGSGAGLVLIGGSGIEYTYALRLTFPSTNNEAEYEALLTGLRIARQMNISNIEVKVDSKIVACQINENYEATKDSMIKDMAKAKEYASGFKSFSIENIPRNMNQKADVLSKLAYVAFNYLMNEANYGIREIHIGSYGMHVGPRTVVRKAVRQGYYWSTMHEDAKKEVKKCDPCQIHALVPRLLKTLMTSIMAPWPFYQWAWTS